MKKDLNKIQLFLDKADLPHKDKIYDYLIYEKKIILLYNVYDIDYLDSYPSVCNIWCIDQEGKVLWVIERPISRRKRADGSEVQDPFVSIWKDEETKKIRVASFNSLDYDLDPETGKISNPVFTK